MGLNVNSIPVVIGAMLISPLMGPIMGIGMALGINDSYLLKRSFGNLLVMTVASIMVSAIYFFVSPLDLDNPTELLARTNPTMYDVLIALFGGFAVIMAVCLKEKGSIIAGAAIATALMPPLCTAGYGLANGSVTFFLGAIYLYLINSIFIALATFITVRYLHFPMVRIRVRTMQLSRIMAELLHGCLGFRLRMMSMAVVFRSGGRLRNQMDAAGGMMRFLQSLTSWGGCH